MKIEASNQLLFQYETEIKRLENDNSYVNYEYNLSFQIFQWSKELEDYRQNLMEYIAINTHKLNQLNDSLKKQERIHVLLNKCYWFINKY